ncbi:hypothetical protein, partial [Thauera aminoaromatica]|uniref:hypothetical protein n=1 Tax=Thauera aminoaromatica TaxID=164330 RepID=UPI0023F50D69
VGLDTQLVAPEFYRHPYRHLDWDTQAQLSPSIDIYRGQSALPRWPAFEIYRHLSAPTTIASTLNAPASMSEQQLMSQEVV